MPTDSGCDRQPCRRDRSCWRLGRARAGSKSLHDFPENVQAFSKPGHQCCIQGRWPGLCPSVRLRRVARPCPYEPVPPPRGSGRGGAVNPTRPHEVAPPAVSERDTQNPARKRGRTTSVAGRDSVHEGDGGGTEGTEKMAGRDGGPPAARSSPNARRHRDAGTPRAMPATRGTVGDRSDAPVDR